MSQRRSFLDSAEVEELAARAGLIDAPGTPPRGPAQVRFGGGAPLPAPAHPTAPPGDDTSGMARVAGRPVDSSGGTTLLFDAERSDLDPRRLRIEGTLPPAGPRGRVPADALLDWSLASTGCEIGVVLDADGRVAAEINLPHEWSEAVRELARAARVLGASDRGMSIALSVPGGTLRACWAGAHSAAPAVVMVGPNDPGADLGEALGGRLALVALEEPDEDIWGGAGFASEDGHATYAATVDEHEIGTPDHSPESPPETEVEAGPESTDLALPDDDDMPAISAEDVELADEAELFDDMPALSDEAPDLDQDDAPAVSDDVPEPDAALGLAGAGDLAGADGGRSDDNAEPGEDVGGPSAEETEEDFDSHGFDRFSRESTAVVEGAVPGRPDALATRTEPVAVVEDDTSADAPPSTERVWCPPLVPDPPETTSLGVTAYAPELDAEPAPETASHLLGANELIVEEVDPVEFADVHDAGPGDDPGLLGQAAAAVGWHVALLRAAIVARVAPGRIAADTLDADERERVVAAAARIARGEWAP
jgi:hypothetical protein